MPELSIIVPVYKVEKYLPKCIDSILAQTFRDFELILIDDGSPDNCGAICDDYAARDSRIKVIHQENAGVSAARNAGLDIATGTYLGFVDSDDWIEPEMYETMIVTAKEKNVDLVVCGCQCWKNDYLVSTRAFETSGEYEQEEMLETLFVPPFELGHICWNKLYLFSKIKDIRFPSGMSIGEDGVYSFKCFAECNNAIKIYLPFYNLLEHEDSATKNSARLFHNTKHLLESRYALLKMARDYSTSLERVALDKYMNDCIRHLSFLKKSKEQRVNVAVLTFCTKWKMLIIILHAFRTKLFPQSKLNGFIYEWIRL